MFHSSVTPPSRKTLASLVEDELPLDLNHHLAQAMRSQMRELVVDLVGPQRDVWYSLTRKIQIYLTHLELQVILDIENCPNLKAYDSILRSACSARWNSKYFDKLTVGIYESAYYARCYDGLLGRRDAKKMIDDWAKTTSPDTFQVDLRADWENLNQNGGPEVDNEAQNLLYEIITTRVTRWERLATLIGIEVPTHFRAFRGAKGRPLIQDVVSAWTANEKVEVPAKSLASWSLKKSGTKSFAGPKLDSVLYESVIPIEKTLVDLWVDDSRFLTRHWNQAEIVTAIVPEDDDVLVSQPDKVTVWFQGKRYKYKDREHLIGAWNLAPNGV